MPKPGPSRWAVRPRLLGFVIDTFGVSAPPTNPAPPEGPSIVVLPLVNAGGDAGHEYLTDGLTEDLTTALSRCSRYVFVISSETAFTYRGQNPASADLGARLGVRYILKGSVARVGDTIRVHAELVEAATDRTLWSEHVERELADVRELQAAIVERILVAVGFELEAAELERIAATPATSIGAIEALWRGYYHLRQLTRDDLMQARALFQRAFELEPGLASAYGMLAGTYTQEHSQGWSFDETLLDRARHLASQGVELDDTSGVCHAILGVVELVQGNWKEAVTHEDRAIALEPSVTWPHALRGMAMAQGGHLIEATRSIRRALRLDPHPPHGLLMALAYINYGAGRRGEAIELLQKVRAENRDSIIARVALAAFQQREGDREIARACAQEILAINPAMTVERGMSLIPALERITPRHEFARYPEDLATAGLPRGSAPATAS
jgi:adenylate cyclase